MKKIKFVFIIGIAIGCISLTAYPWSKSTHKAITEHVEERNEVLDKYLINLGFSDGNETTFTISLSYYMPPDFFSRFYLHPIDKVYESMEGDQTAFNWLKTGSTEEDGPDAGEVPLTTRARNHFHDPTTLG